MIISAVLLFGCLGGGAQPSATPSTLPSPAAITGAVVVGPEYDAAVDDAGKQIADINQLTNDIGQSQVAITDDELNALG